MVKYTNFAGRFSSANPLKVFSIFFDVSIHLFVTLDSLHACAKGRPFSSSVDQHVSSILGIVLGWGVVGFILEAAIFLRCKHGPTCYKRCPDLQYSKEGACYCPSKPEEEKCICCVCPRDNDYHCMCGNCSSTRDNVRMCLLRARTFK
jgi:hypothetical protein